MELWHPGVGTVGHIGTELLKSRSGINPCTCRMPGYPQVATAMLGGQLQMALLPPALAQAQVKAGKLRAIGVTSVGAARWRPMCRLAEAGIQNFELEIWNAFAAPATMPKALQVRLATVLATLPARQRCAQAVPARLAGGRHIARGVGQPDQGDTAALGQIIAQRGIKAE